MEELSEKDARQVLEQNTVGRLGCFSPSENRTYVVPVSYAYRDGVATFVSIDGQKLRYLREHPDGNCLEVDLVDNVKNWTSVIAVGRFEELDPEERRQHRYTTLLRATAGPLRFALANGDIYREASEAVIWILRIQQVSGRRETWDSIEQFRYW